LTGIVVGAVTLAGLSLLLAGARRTSRRGSAARRGLRQSRRETAAVSQDRDDLIGQRDTARAHTASTLGNGVQRGDPHRDADDSRWSGLRLFGHQFAGRPAVVEPPESVTGKPASDELPARPPPQSNSQTAATHEYRQEDRAQGRSGQRLRHETVGRLTGNRRLRARGRRDQAKGNVKQYGTKIKDALKR
jgi:hypothetical protein